MIVTARVNDVITKILGSVPEDFSFDLFSSGKIENLLAIDSYDTAEVVVDLEAEFDLDISNDDMLEIHTVQDMVKYIEEKINS